MCRFYGIKRITGLSERVSMSKIKMIGLDLDGTLLTSNKELTEYTIKILKQAIEQGIIVLVATGRPYTGIPEELRKFSGMRYALTANGARIIDTWEDKVLFEKLFPISSAKKALEIFDKYDTLQEVYFDGQGYAEEEKLSIAERYHRNPAMWKYIRSTRKSVGSLNDIIAKENKAMDKVQAVFADLHEKELAWEELSKIKEFEIVSSLGYNIEINTAGVNKGTGLLELGKLLGIQRDEIMACGDGDNDEAMLREVGFGVAMGNATDFVKAAADYITETNDEEGAAKAIERFALKGESLC